jgi:hypothetical protein
MFNFKIFTRLVLLRIATVTFFLLQTTQVQALLVIPLPNLSMPPAYQKIIDALEESNETKAAAFASEDKSFGSKQWVIGHYSGHVTQEEANRIALQRCNQSLSLQKEQMVGGKPLYDFGNKTCNLYDFKNKSISQHIKVNSLPQASTDDRVEKTKTEIDLPLGWIERSLTDQMKNTQIDFWAYNKTIDAGLRFFTYPKAVILSSEGFIKNTREMMKNSLKQGVYTEIEQLKINGNNAFRFELNGLVGANDTPMTYLVTFVEGNKSLVRLDVWMAQSNFPNYKDELIKFATRLKGVDFLKTESKKNNVAESTSNLTSNQNEGEAQKPINLSNTKKMALVIGNNKYKTISSLMNAVDDARSVADALGRFGYTVTLKMDQNEKEMKTALRVFKNQVNPGDEVVFFYAGHGVQLGLSNFLLPIDVGADGEDQVKDEGIALQRFLDDMNERKAKFTLAILDACRDNPFKTAGRNLGGGVRGLAPTSAATGQMIIFSAGSGQQALDKVGNSDKSKNGLFTRILIKEMQNSNQTIDRLIKNVRKEVAEIARSIGHEQVPAIYDQALGDFYFKK